MRLAWIQKKALTARMNMWSQKASQNVTYKPQMTSHILAMPQR